MGISWQEQEKDTGNMSTTKESGSVYNQNRENPTLSTNR